VLVGGGLAIMAFTGGFDDLAPVRFALPKLATFTVADVWTSLVRGGFAQVPLTTANAVIATSSLITSYWPDEHVSPRKLAFSHGVMNLVAPWFGGMPMCHGAGGLVGQYFYGARTAGTNLIEGAIEVVLGLFFAGSIAALFGAFPRAIVGAMMFMVGVELVKFVRHVRSGRTVAVAAVTVAVALLTNMAVGFLVGVAVHYATSAMTGRARAEDGEDAGPGDDGSV
jgi:MFS superfamily sulfate permease-like transporter